MIELRSTKSFGSKDWDKGTNASGNRSFTRLQVFHFIRKFLAQY